LQPHGFHVVLADMKFESFGISDLGCKRERNEDSFFVNNDLLLFMVADGMGGHLGGEYASKLAVQTVEETITMLTDDPNVTLQDDVELKPGDFKAWLKYAIGTASQRIFEKAAQDHTLNGMGTTAVVQLFRKNRVYLANVGDSRGYRIRGNKIDQLTTDHSLVSEQIRAGILKPKEAKEHRLKNIITRSVGFQEDVEVDVETRAMKEGDTYLLCSDGLYNLIENDEILDVVTHHNIAESGKHLIDIAKARGGDDNITVVLTKVLELDEKEAKEDEESTLQM